MHATSIDVPQSQSALRIVNEHLRFPRVSLIERSSSHFVHIAAEIDRRLPFLPSVLDNFAANNVAAMPILVGSHTRAERSVMDQNAVMTECLYRKDHTCCPMKRMS